MAPPPPNARQRPGKAVALLDSGRRPRNGPPTPQRSAAPRQSRGAPRLRAEAPKWPPHPPTLGSAPAKPWRSSTQGGGPEMAPPPPNARQRPGKSRGAPRLRAEAPKWPPHPPTLGSAPATPRRASTQGGGPPPNTPTPRTDHTTSPR